MIYESMIAETIKIKGYNSDPINAYTARPMGAGPFSGVVLIPVSYTHLTLPTILRV